jgi:hypothetical protein
MNEPMKQSISERMAARQGEAETKIKALLWGGGDADEVAGVALAGGIDPARVDKLAAEIDKAKAVLATAIEANTALPGLDDKLSVAKSAVAKTSAALSKAISADEDARGALGDVEAAVILAQDARRAALNAALYGTLPADMWPAWLRTLAAEARAADERQKAASRAAFLRHGIRRLRDSIAHLENEVDRIAKSKNRDREMVAGPGGLQDAGEAMKAQLNTEKSAMAAAEKELAQIEAA